MKNRLIAISTVFTLVASLLVLVPAITGAHAGNARLSILESYLLGSTPVWTATAQPHKNPGRAAPAAIFHLDGETQRNSLRIVLLCNPVQKYSPRVTRIASPRAPPVEHSAVL